MNNPRPAILLLSYCRATELSSCEHAERETQMTNVMHSVMLKVYNISYYHNYNTETTFSEFRNLTVQMNLEYTTNKRGVFFPWTPILHTQRITECLTDLQLSSKWPSNLHRPAISLRSQLADYFFTKKCNTSLEAWDAIVYSDILKHANQTQVGDLKPVA